AALNAGALSFGISGSGPSVFSFSSSLETAQQVGQAISDSFAHLNINSEIYAGKINQNGPKLIVE
ncbi:MAG: homoserine kinase, partial [Bacteroidia bacterium]|nr:homoserine kinase [Bacteroidia bacterium]